MQLYNKLFRRAFTYALLVRNFKSVSSSCEAAFHQRPSDKMASNNQILFRRHKYSEHQS